MSMAKSSQRSKIKGSKGKTVVKVGQGARVFLVSQFPCLQLLFGGQLISKSVIDNYELDNVRR